VRVAESSGHVSLDDAATEAAWTWTFRPATRAGEPVAARYAMPVTFRLED
jgi:protein TonB